VKRMGMIDSLRRKVDFSTHHGWTKSTLLE
jgi:hypothetical protein